MFRYKTKTLLIIVAAIGSQMATASQAQAGPLMDWLLGRNRCCRPLCAAPAAAPAPCATCQTTCQQTCSRTVVNYVPYTAYRTDWERVPVTTYRQTTSTDPCTGCTVTCNRPCTTYSWRMKQTPYTTYRPVYSQETYQVPVTYTTQVAQAPMMAAPVAAGGCATCATGYAPTATYAAPVTGTPYPQYYQAAPATGVYQPTPATGTGTTEADTIPTLNAAPPAGSTTSSYWPTQTPMQPTAAPIRPLQDPTPEVRVNTNAAPQLINPFHQTTRSPSVQRWGYSPVQLASYEAPADMEADVPAALRPNLHNNEYVGQVTPAATTGQPQSRVNEGWRRD